MRWIRHSINTSQNIILIALMSSLFFSCSLQSSGQNLSLKQLTIPQECINIGNIGFALASLRNEGIKQAQVVEHLRKDNMPEMDTPQFKQLLAHGITKAYTHEDLSAQSIDYLMVGECLSHNYFPNDTKILKEIITISESCNEKTQSIQVCFEQEYDRAFATAKANKYSRLGRQI